MKIWRCCISFILIFLIIFSLSCDYNIQADTPTPSMGLEVEFLDVGQADSILIRVNGSTMLIDAGTNSGASELVKELKAKNISKFDVVIGTHPHEDHIGGLDAVIKEFEVGSIYMPRVSSTTKTFSDVLIAIQDKGFNVTTPVDGTSFLLGNAQCTLLAPISEKYTDTNNHSIVIRLVYGNTSFIFMGDAETISEEEMLTKNYTLDSDVIKVGHHGSKSSTSDEFLQAVSPRYAVISVSEDNEYGHPEKEILEKLNAAGINIYRTDLQGDVTFISSGTDITVSTER